MQFVEVFPDQLLVDAPALYFVEDSLEQLVMEFALVSPKLMTFLFAGDVPEKQLLLTHSVGILVMHSAMVSSPEQLPH